MTVRKNTAVKDPFADCVIARMVARGERREYYYPQNGLPRMAVKSAPARSPLLEALRGRGSKK